MDQRESLAGLLDEVLAGMVSAEDVNQRIEQSTDYDEIWDVSQNHDYIFDALLLVALDQERGARGTAAGESGRQLREAATRLRAEAATLRDARLREASLPLWRRVLRRRRSDIRAVLIGGAFTAAVIAAWIAWTYFEPRIKLTDDQGTQLTMGAMVVAAAIGALFMFDQHLRSRR